ncbi:hypothetical protein HY008_00195 [Candidatus Woesebacteria bacterium]|nr:hypothetical protein [Candidatus Woesebacteria bacterium]
MSDKSLVMLGMIVGSLIGSYIPVFFGASLFSFASLAGNAVGGIIGIVIANRLT